MRAGTKEDRLGIRRLDGAPILPHLAPGRWAARFFASTSFGLLQAREVAPEGHHTRTRKCRPVTRLAPRRRGTERPTSRLGGRSVLGGGGTMSDPVPTHAHEQPRWHDHAWRMVLEPGAE